MRSRASWPRIDVERALRVVTLIVLAFAAWNTTRAPSQQRVQRAASADLHAALSQWTATSPRHAHIKLDVAPTQEERDWARALRRAGTPLTWQGDGIPALALEVAPVANPRGGTVVWAVAPAGTRLAIADAVAPLDTVVARRGGAMLVAPLTTGDITMATGVHRAAAKLGDRILMRRVLVLGHATWEAKFVITALEESGWSVDARLSVAPGVDVTQGSPNVPDTARHVAVVVLDPPSVRAAAQIARYVRSGGGAVIAGGSGSSLPLAAIAAGRSGSRARPASIVFAEDAPRHALAFFTIAPRADAIVLEERNGRVAAAARRVDAGRVVQIGYDETWRWRMGGGDGAVDAHRGWWSALISNVAYRAVVPLPDEPRDDDAPLTRLVDALGARGAPSVQMNGAKWRPSSALLFTLLIALLLTELASRRLRGAP
jgi:hypothetical protein